MSKSLLKLADFAVGIPWKEHRGEPTVVAPGKLYDFLIARHLAQRSGPHYDIRLGSPLLGLFSWATKKEIPTKPSETIAVYQQPLHKYDYLNFSGEIPAGYGKGIVKPVLKTKVLITDASPEGISFTVDKGTTIDRFKLMKKRDHGSRNPTWYLVNVAPNKVIPEKQSYRVISAEKAHKLIKQLGKTVVSVQPKIDGALTFIHLNKNVELYSPRISLRTGKPIIYTEKVFSTRPKISLPKDLHGSVLLGELYAVAKSGGKEVVIPPNQLSAILNSGLANAISAAKGKHLEFRIYLFDVARLGKEKEQAFENWYNIPYEERKKHIDKFLKFLPSNFHAPIEATDKQNAERLLQDIAKRIHPLTSEGIVIFPRTGKPYKYKTFNEDNFYIVGFTPGLGRLENKAIGGILVSDRPGGEPIAVVGTGLTDELRQELYRNKEDYLGRQMRVKYQERTPGGSLRAPVFLGFE